jgi:DNA-binding MarR family transcriptional regulator
MSEIAQNGNADEARRRELVAIAHDLDDWYSLLGRQFGPLSRPQRRMLRLLDREQARRVGDLAEELDLTTAGATRMLDKMESLGYATRTRAAHSDQRQVYVTLTEAGQQALQEADAAFLARVEKTLHALTREEQASLAHLLHILRTRHSTQTSFPD